MLVGGYTVLQLQANRIYRMRGEIDITPLKQSPRPAMVSHMRGIKSISSLRWAGLPSKVASESNYKSTLGCTGKITAINHQSQVPPSNLFSLSGWEFTCSQWSSKSILGLWLYFLLFSLQLMQHQREGAATPLWEDRRRLLDTLPRRRLPAEPSQISSIAFYPVRQSARISVHI